MSELIAKPVIKNKFWVVEESGNKIATIQARDDGGYAYVHDEQREYFPSVKNLKQKYNIKFGSSEKNKKENCKSVYGFPIIGRAYNQVWDVQRRLPIYSKTPKSKSLFCAGYYLIQLNREWTEHFCPKNITLARYQYLGPFKTKDEIHDILKETQCKSSV
jgi:hypothetical protein